MKAKKIYQEIIENGGLYFQSDWSRKEKAKYISNMYGCSMYVATNVTYML